MDKELSPKAAAFIIILFGSILFGIFWANGKVSSTHGFSHLHTHPDGELFIQFDNELLAFNRNGVLTQAYNLDDFGIDGRGADFSFFANGDLLIRKGRPEHGLIFNFMRYLRLRNPTPESGDDMETMLVRCKLAKKQCEPLKHGSMNLNDAHSLEIDQATDRIFVADSSRHQIYLTDSEGRMLARLDKNLHFPNQIVYHDSRLYIANTNHHEISIYSVNENGFGPPLAPITVDTSETRKSGQTWPASVMLQDGTIWVKNAQNGMADGGVYRFESSGRLISKVDLPADADPYAMAQLGSTILITDFSRDKIYQTGPEGGFQGQFRPQAIADRITKVTEVRQHYSTISMLFAGLFVVALTIGIALALREDKKSKGEIPNSAGRLLSEEEVARARKDPRVHWIVPEKSREYKMAMWLLPTVTLIPALVLIPLFLGREDVLQTSELVRVSASGAVLAGITLTLTWFLRRSQHSRIGVYGQLLILMDHRGRTALGKGPEILYGNQFIAINNVMIHLGQGAFRIFPLPDLTKHVYPLLHDSVYLSNSQAASYMMKNSAQGRISLALILVTLVAVLVYQIFL